MKFNEGDSVKYLGKTYEVYSVFEDAVTGQDFYALVNGKEFTAQFPLRVPAADVTRRAEPDEE